MRDWDGPTAVDLEAAELQRGLARQQADKVAWHAFNQMERAIGAVRAALEDDDLGPEWRDQLRTVALRAGALAIEQEGC
jgi:hypothetical protein